MPLNPYSVSNLCLLLITVAFIVYFVCLWQWLKHKVTAPALAGFKKPVLRFVCIYTFYFTGISLLAANHFFATITMPPRFLLIILPLMAVVVTLSRASLHHSLRFLQFVPPFLLVGVQAYRLAIELVFVQFAHEKIIPLELSLLGRNYDLWIGVLAIPVAWLLRRQHRWAPKAAIIFNVLGLLSLLNILSIVIPSVPSAFRVYDMLYLPTYFPGILIVFLASAAIFLHILSLRQLMHFKQTQLYRGENKLVEENSLMPR